MNDGAQQKTKRIYKNMPFLTLDFLSCIVAIRVDRSPAAPFGLGSRSLVPASIAQSEEGDKL